MSRLASNQKNIRCPYCGEEAISTVDEIEYAFVTCPICGRYKYQSFPFVIGENIKDKVASYLFYKGKVEEHADKRFFNYLGEEEEFYKRYAETPWCNYATIEEIGAFYPKSFAERITKILLGVAKRSSFLGDVVSYSHGEALSAMFISRYDKTGRSLEQFDVDNQLNYLFEYLKENKYAEIGGDYDSIKIILQANGWKRVDELQSDDKNNKNVFVSMAFNKGTKETREALRTGIISAGYSPEFIDEIIHNKQIVPEMFRLIRESRFLILEITEPNYGAYYEAGYALGLGKEVIICCKDEIFRKKYESKEEKKYERYMKPHFDIAQKQILVWDDCDDLTNKLTEWIKAII